MNLDRCLTSATSERGSKEIFSQITFLKSVHSNEKYELYPRYMSLPGSHNRRTEKAEEVKFQKRKWGKNSVFLRAKFRPSLNVIEISKVNSDLLYMVLGYFWNFATFKEGWNLTKLRVTKTFLTLSVPRFHKSAKVPYKRPNNSDLL